VAADNELRLLSRAIRTRDIAPLLSRGVEDSWFLNDSNQAVWRFLKDHWTKYQEVPTATTVMDNFPTYRLLAVEDSLDYLLDQLVEFRRRNKSIDVIQQAASAIESGDHNSAISIMGKGYAALIDEGAVLSEDIDLTDQPMERYNSYLNIKTRPNGLLGMATGFQVMDLATAGLQGGQLITIIAPPKTGKSVLAMQMAVNVHNDGWVPAFQSFEMSNTEQEHRHDSMRAHISNNRLVRGCLKPAEETRYQKMLTDMETMHHFYLTESISAYSVSQLSLKMEKLRPNILFVDGVYLMTDEISGERGTPIALRNITQSLKRVAQKFDIPIVQTTQVLNSKVRGGQITADSIAFSSSFHQDSDVIFALQRQDEEDDSSRLLKIVASRNTGPAEVELLWDWEEGKFQEYGA
jgi:replicative DNA helicase